MRALSRPFTVLLAVLLAAGCAVKVRPTGALPGGYEDNDLPDSPGMILRLAEPQDLTFEPLLPTLPEREELRRRKLPLPDAEALGIDVSTSESLLLVIEPVVWRSGMPIKRKTRDELLFTTRERLYRHALRNYPPPVRVRFNVRDDDPLVRRHRTVRVRSAITDSRGGNGPARFLIGFGLGCSALQLEGELVEDGERIGEFAVRTLHGGYAHWGSNIRVLSDAYCLRYAADAAAERLMTTLPNHLPGARPLSPDAQARVPLPRDR